MAIAKAKDISTRGFSVAVLAKILDKGSIPARDQQPMFLKNAAQVEKQFTLDVVLQRIVPYHAFFFAFNC